MTLESVKLLGAEGIRLLGAFVVPSRGKIPYGGLFNGYPPGGEQAKSGKLDWDHQVPLDGATLQPGDKHGWVIGLQSSRRVAVGRYKSLRFRYSAGNGQMYAQTLAYGGLIKGPAAGSC